MSRYELYLNDILRTIDLIDESVKDLSFDEFRVNLTLVDATAMRLQIIGESLKKIPPKFKKSKEVKWTDLQNLRDIISHSYFKINASILFSIINEELPKLEKEIKAIKINLLRN